MDPFVLFEKWFSEEEEQSNLKLPAACCLSSVGVDGYPNARFVSLKRIERETFVITGPLSSRKGKEIVKNAKAALTFWWTSTERQIRIQGDVTLLSEANANLYFEQRNRDSKIVSTVFEQGSEIESVEHLQNQFREQKEKLGGQKLKRPENWGGFSIKPIRIEFMEFKKSRLHERKLYERGDNEWKMRTLQP